MNAPVAAPPTTPAAQRGGHDAAGAQLADTAERRQALARARDAMFRGALRHVESMGAVGDEPRPLRSSLLEVDHPGGLDEILGHVAGIVQAAASEVVRSCPEALRLSGRDPAGLAGVAFARIRYEQVIELLAADFPLLRFGDDLQAGHAAAIVERLGPTFVTHYPMAIGPQGARRDEHDLRTVRSSRLLLPLAGESAASAERDTAGHDPLRSDAGIRMDRVARWVLGIEDDREHLP